MPHQPKQLGCHRVGLAVIAVTPLCLPPRKRCYLLTSAKHRKILRTLRVSATSGCLAFERKKQKYEIKKRKDIYETGFYLS
jgi:hypothetical protein